MRLSFLAALAAATALIPAAASAQHHDRDRGGQHQRGDRGHSNRGDHARPTGQHARPQPNRARGNAAARIGRPDLARSRDFAHRNDGRITRPAPARTDRNWRAQAGGSHAGDRPDRNDWNRSRANQRKYADDQARARNHDRNDRGQDWNRGHNDHDRWNRNRGDHDGRWQRGRNDHGRFDRNWRHNNRYDWRDYRTRNRRIYHLPRYYAPYGWDYGYRRFGIGFRLDTILFGSNYWISDPYYYRLPPAYGPYRWVRYYNDALLVDIETGEMVDVVYDIFW
jgi:hypothetical protein